MKSKRTRKFHDLYEALPEGVQKQADRAYDTFVENPNYPSLNFKQLEGDPVWYSARIGINYRAVCVRDGDSYVWLWIGSHAEYDNLLKHR